MKFPAGSEVIMSAVNIPDMSRVLHHHHLKIVPLDVHIETMAPKLDLLQSLITEKTKILLLAHIYSKLFDVGPFIEMARKHNIFVIEDLAQGFVGFENIGHPDSDLALFSFGVIKFSTTFGGAIAKIKDPQLFSAMSALYSTYPLQSRGEYLRKVLKYMFFAVVLNTPIITGINNVLYRYIGFDAKGPIINLLRGFPDQFILRLRHQPCTALLGTMKDRFMNYQPSNLASTNAKGDYVSEHLTDEVTQIGNQAMVKNYWLFPVIVVSY